MNTPYKSQVEAVAGNCYYRLFNKRKRMTRVKIFMFVRQTVGSR